jgi:TPR repeat protein/uncharacterized membrane protein YhaH (DUF805 family)
MALPLFLVPLQRFADFKGRSGRSEYWHYAIAYAVFVVILSIGASILFGERVGQSLGNLITLTLLIPTINVQIRRLHDVGYSGWYLLWSFTVIAIPWIIYLSCKNPDEKINRYGPSNASGEHYKPIYFYGFFLFILGLLHFILVVSNEFARPNTQSSNRPSGIVPDAGVSNGDGPKKIFRDAEQGDAKAQSQIAIMYFKGEGMLPNDKEAARWALKAANQGDPVSQGLLGVMYQLGRGVEQNDAEAVFWLQKSAAQNDLVGLLGLGDQYINGRGVSQSDSEGFRLYRRAAEQGNSTAQHLLGSMYFIGQGVEKSEVEAVRWFRSSADNGDPKGQTALAEMYVNGTGVPQSDAEGIKWYRKAADQGDSDAQYALGNMYEAGRGTEKSYAEAVKWFRKAAENGNADAQNDLGLAYLKGQGVTQDYVQAHMWFNIASTADGEDNAGIRTTARKNRDIVAAEMSPNQIAEAQRLATSRARKIK